MWSVKPWISLLSRSCRAAAKSSLTLKIPEFGVSSPAVNKGWGICGWDSSPCENLHCSVPDDKIISRKRSHWYLIPLLSCKETRENISPCRWLTFPAPPRADCSQARSKVNDSTAWESWPYHYLICICMVDKCMFGNAMFCVLYRSMPTVHIWSWSTGWFCLSKVVGLDDHQRLLPTSALLCLYLKTTQASHQ